MSKRLLELNMITDTQHTCPICSLESKYIFTTKHTREVFQCSNDKCGHYFTPILDHRQGVCDRIEDIQKESEESLKIYEDRNLRLLDLFKTYLSAATKPYRLLDFGAGNAHISRTFKEELKDDCVIYCLEPNPLCTCFYSKYNINQVKKIDDIPELIDLIYMIEVIEHLTDPISVLKSLRSKLKPDGMIFISTPSGAENESLTKLVTF